MSFNFFGLYHKMARARPTTTFQDPGPSTSSEDGRPVFRILLSCSSAMTHIQSILDVGDILLQAGHHITFAHRAENRILALEHGFDFIAFEEYFFINLGECMDGWFVDNMYNKCHSQDKKMFANWSFDDRDTFSRFTYEFDATDKTLRKILQRLQKSYDILIGDFETRYPCTFNTILPFVPIYSMNPLPLYSNGPPAFSGYPVDHEMRIQRMYRDSMMSVFDLMYERLCAWWRVYHVPDLPKEYWFVEEPKYLGAYRYIESLDYKDCGPLTYENYMRIGPDLKKFNHIGPPFTVPKHINKLPGSLIYVNLGNLPTADFDWISDFIKILGQLPHRFIIYKGPHGNELALPANMVGSHEADQSAIIHFVDLVITHGGTMTIMECIFRQKPMIVVPFFLDQYDNAQRIVDCGIGQRLTSYGNTEEIVLNAINEIINDKTILLKLSRMSHEMRRDDSRQRFRERVEIICRERRAVRSALAGLVDSPDDDDDDD